MSDIKAFIAEHDAFARHVGVELLEVGEGRARARMAVTENHMNGLGLVHGAAIFTLADLAFAAASNSHGNAAVAVNVSVNFVTGAKSGVLLAEAVEVSLNPKLATYDVRVTTQEGTLLASFTGMVYRKKERIP